MKKILTCFIAILVGLSFFAPSPVFADCAGVSTSIIDCGDDEDGVQHILDLVIDIMTIGIGILGVIGITIVGIQYLTAGGSEEKVRKAKRRMFEIIIGLVAYVVVYAFLRWLLPNFSGSDISPTNSTNQSQEVTRPNNNNSRQIQ